ncbi:MAG: YqzL family protein [Eubacteriales bacterium]
MLLPAEFFWRIFEATGSITAYIIYKRLDKRVATH